MPRRPWGHDRFDDGLAHLNVARDRLELSLIHARNARSLQASIPAIVRNADEALAACKKAERAFREVRAGMEDLWRARTDDQATTLPPRFD